MGDSLSKKNVILGLQWLHVGFQPIDPKVASVMEISNLENPGNPKRIVSAGWVESEKMDNTVFLLVSTVVNCHEWNRMK